MKSPTKEQLKNAEPLKITTQYDIRKVITDFMPRKLDDVPVKSQIRSLDQSGKPVIYAVSAPASCDYHSQLLEGLQILKTRLEASQRVGNSNLFMINAHNWVDTIIERRLGGKRDGLRIRWDLPDGIYFFDPFTGKLTRSDPVVVSPNQA